jgi:hypothetical protein
MQWIRSDFTSLATLKGQSFDDLIEQLHELQIDTVEDLAVFWQEVSLKQKLIDYLKVVPQQIEMLLDHNKKRSLLASNAGFFSPLSENQLKLCHFGLLKPDENHQAPANFSRVRLAAKAYHTNQKVTSISHIDKLPSVKSQGSRGTCSAFSGVGLREFFCQDPPTSLSEQFLYWAAKQKDGLENESGTYLHSIIDAMQYYGVCPQENWQYNPNQGETEHQGPPPRTALEAAKQFKIIKGIAIPRNNVDAMRSVLAGTDELSGRVIAFGIPVFKSWQNNPITFRTGKIPMPIPGEENDYEGGHALLLVGYQDDISWPGGGYFIFRNSWDHWGEGNEYGAGYGTVPYAFISEYCWDAWTAEVNPEVLLQPLKTKKENKLLVLLSLLFTVLIGFLILSFLSFPGDSKDKLQVVTNNSERTGHPNNVKDEKQANVIKDNAVLFKPIVDTYRNSSVLDIDYFKLNNGLEPHIEHLTHQKQDFIEIIYFNNAEHAQNFINYFNHKIGMNALFVHYKDINTFNKKYCVFFNSDLSEKSSILLHQIQKVIKKKIFGEC